MLQSIKHGMEYLHSQGIAHLDLKTGNISIDNQQFRSTFNTLSKNGPEKLWRDEPCIIKLSDFGTAWGSSNRIESFTQQHVL